MCSQTASTISTGMCSDTAGAHIMSNLGSYHNIIMTERHEYICACHSLAVVRVGGLPHKLDHLQVQKHEQ
jgi:hypothetical protein